MLSPLPRHSHWRYCLAHPSSDISLPRKGHRVGLCIGLFEAYSAFTRVTARTLALPPVRGTLTRRLQPFRYLHDCSGCFRLERLPGGPCTHRKAPPFHGARPKRPITHAHSTADSRPWPFEVVDGSSLQLIGTRVGTSCSLARRSSGSPRHRQPETRFTSHDNGMRPIRQIQLVEYVIDVIADGFWPDA